MAGETAFQSANSLARPVSHGWQREGWGLLLSCVFALPFAARAQGGADLATIVDERKIWVHGAATCSSAMCHGGADEHSRQFTLWSQRDVHSRGYATLGTARAARMAEAVRISDPKNDVRCTICHAPVAAMARERLAPDARASEGISCDSCHGPSDAWLRSHTRPDYTHGERVAAGMRDLRDLRLRASACVACHQNIEPELVTVGRHPELLFELDGQANAEPKHWREDAAFNGAQAWFVGQAVAWREITWALLHGNADPVRDAMRWRALRWVLQRAWSDRDFPALGQLPDEATPTALHAALGLADELAGQAAQGWSDDVTFAALSRLAASSGDFNATEENAPLHARRAERLVLALDRLVAALPADRRLAGVSAHVDRLFALAQSIDDFKPDEFAREMTDLRRRLEIEPSR